MKKNRKKCPKVAFYTLGCKVNQYETNAMIQELKNNAYEIVDFKQKADIYIINTCTVTNMSDRKSRNMLRKTKELNKDAIVVAVRLLCSSRERKFRRIRGNRFNIRN